MDGKEKTFHHSYTKGGVKLPGDFFFFFITRLLFLYDYDILHMTISYTRGNDNDDEYEFIA